MGTEETTEVVSEATIKYTTATVVSRRAMDDPPLPISLDHAREVVFDLFKNGIEVVDNTPDVITLEKKRMDGAESEIDLGEGQPTVRVEKGSLEIRYIFTPMARNPAASADMSLLNETVRRLRRATK